MKTVKVAKPVRDVDGLLNALKKCDPPFSVVTVGADARSTFVYLQDDESKDPAPVVEGWMDAPEIRLSSNGKAGMMGVSEAFANGLDTHTVLIQKADPAGNVLPGVERLSVTSPQGVKISNASPRLQDGLAMVQVGPVEKCGDLVIEVSDRGGSLRVARLHLRFVSPPPTPPEEAPRPTPSPAQKTGLLATIRRVLGI